MFIFIFCFPVCYWKLSAWQSIKNPKKLHVWFEHYTIYMIKLCWCRKKLSTPYDKNNAVGSQDLYKANVFINIDARMHRGRVWED